MLKPQSKAFYCGFVLEGQLAATAILHIEIDFDSSDCTLQQTERDQKEIERDIQLRVFEFEKNSKMGYWKTKVLPTIKKVFENKGSIKKAEAAEACKTFDESKESYAKEFEEKKAEYQVKVVELYEASSAEIKTLIKERKLAALKKYSAAVHKFLEELAKIEFPGSKPVSEASSKYGPAYVSGPVFFVFEKVSTYIVTEEKVAEPTPPEPTPAKAEEETSSGKEKEIVIEEEKKEEVVEVKKEEEVVEVEEKKEEPEASCAEEKPKVEEAAPAAEPAKP